MIALRVAGTPKFVQVSRQAARGANDDVFSPTETIDDVDDFALRNPRISLAMDEARYFGGPVLVESRRSRAKCEKFLAQVVASGL